jgi:hypothetical protein
VGAKHDGPAQALLAVGVLTLQVGDARRQAVDRLLLPCERSRQLCRLAVEALAADAALARVARHVAVAAEEDEVGAGDPMGGLTWPGANSC